MDPRFEFGRSLPYFYRYRGPSRFVWFCIGAAAATLWSRQRERSPYGFHRNCVRPPIPPNLPGSDASSSEWSPRDIPRFINNVPPADMAYESKLIEEEKERLRDVGQKAGDKLAELSEATLEAVSSTLEVLKGKLAERRAEREGRVEKESILDRSVQQPHEEH